MEEHMTWRSPPAHCLAYPYTKRSWGAHLPSCQMPYTTCTFLHNSTETISEGIRCVGSSLQQVGLRRRLDTHKARFSTSMLFLVYTDLFGLADSRAHTAVRWAKKKRVAPSVCAN